MSFVSGLGKTNIDIIYSQISRLPNVGEEIYAKDFSLQLGGGAPATLLNLSRLGVNTKLATFLGKDMFSEFAFNKFAECGVSPVNLFDGRGFPLNVSTAVLTENDRTFISYGPEKEPTAEQKDSLYEMSTGSKIALMQKGYLDVYKKLKEEGTLLVFDTGWEDDLSLEKYSDYLSLADYYTPNQKEALKITGANSVESAAKILSNYLEKVIIKLDKDGCLGMENGEVFYLNNAKGFEYIDSTGAGDAFLAGFVYGLFHNYSFRNSIACGNLTGGKCVTAVGCLTEYLTESQLLEMLKQEEIPIIDFIKCLA